MSLFRTDSIALCYANVDSARKWWVEVFDCRPAKVPADWDWSLPSDVALVLPGYDEPTILLCDRAEVQQAGFDRSGSVSPILFCDKLKQAHELLTSRGIAVGPIHGDSETQFFEISDIDGNAIEICKEP